MGLFEGTSAFAAYDHDTVYCKDEGGSVGFQYYWDENCQKPWDGSVNGIAKIVLRNGTKKIPDMNFSGYSFTTEFIIPDSVTSIGKGAFSGTGISGITLPAGITEISDNCFDRCQSLQNITIPNRVTSIGSEAFNECDHLNKAVLPAGLKSIGMMAFSECLRLPEISIPSSVTSIGAGAFGMTDLKKIVIPEGVTELTDAVFDGCEKLTDVQLPKNLRTIGKEVFKEDYALQNITIPAGVETIGKDVFLYDKQIAITGYDNTVAQKYAKANGIPFQSLGAVPAGMYNGATFLGSLTLDTTSYMIPLKASYQIGVNIRGTSDKLKVYSSSPSVASVARLSNGNYKVTGLKAGTAYIMFDVYNQSNQRAAHASVQMTVRKNAAPHGNASRQVALLK